jgi:hypothetical protein
MLVSAVFLLAGCASVSEVSPTSSTDSEDLQTSSTESEDPRSSSTEQAQEELLGSVEGRGVSASDQELVLRTADGEQSFQVREQDLLAVDPDHFNSHVGVADLGYRIYFVTESTINYAVSVEEIDGSTLGFD